MKILLDNNLEFLYQWDLDRYIYLVDIKKNEKIKINFTNKAIDGAIVQEPKTINDLFVCKIPNSLLQYDKDLTVYIVENNKVIFSKTFKVIGRNKPENYVYTDEEQKLYERMEENLLSEIDKKGDSLEYSDNVLSLLSGDKEISKVEIRTGETKINYEDLNDLPSINDVELRGNKTLDELNIQTKGNYIEDNNYNHTDNNYTTEDKDKLQNLENYDDTQVKELIKNLDSNKADKTEIPTRVSQLENDSNYLTQHQDISTKQDTLISGTNIKTINNNSLLGEGNLSIPAPTKVSQLTNDSNFITNAVDNLTNYYLKTDTYSKEEVNNLINAIKSFNIEVVESLPIVMKEATIYLVPSGQSEENNFYNEYIYVNNKVELIGNTKVDISGKQDKLTAGTGIEIGTDNTISVIADNEITEASNGIASSQAVYKALLKQNDWELIRTITVPENPEEDSSDIIWKTKTVDGKNYVIGFAFNTDENGEQYELSDFFADGSVITKNIGGDSNQDSFFIYNDDKLIYLGYRNFFVDGYCWTLFFINFGAKCIPLILSHEEYNPTYKVSSFSGSARGSNLLNTNQSWRKIGFNSGGNLCYDTGTKINFYGKRKK